MNKKKFITPKVEVKAMQTAELCTTSTITVSSTRVVGLSTSRFQAD